MPDRQLDEDYFPKLQPTPEQVIPQSSFLVTWTIIALNVLVYAAMCLKGVSPIHPTALEVRPWGADLGPLTFTGDWWRILTSTFVHFGILHIGMNMYILFQVGPFTELLYGHVRFLLLYLLAGLGGSIVSLAIHPTTTSAGASGAIFGVYGALLAFLVVQRGVIPPSRSRGIAQSAGIFLVYNLFFGLTSRTTDLSAHGGGFVIGFLAGCLLARPAVPGTRKLPIARTAAVALAGFGLIAASFQALASKNHFSPAYRKVAISARIPFRGDHSILYAGAVTRTDAQNLAQALDQAEVADFKEAKIDLLLVKQNGQTDLSFLLNDKAAINPAVAEDVNDITRQVAPAIGGLPITVHLLGDNLEDRNTFTVR